MWVSKVTEPRHSTLVLVGWEGSGIQTKSGMREAVCVKGVAVWGNGSSLDTKSLSLVTGFSYFWADPGRGPVPLIPRFSLGSSARFDGQHLRGNRLTVRVGQIRIDGLSVFEGYRIDEMNQIVPEVLTKNSVSSGEKTPAIGAWAVPESCTFVRVPGCPAVAEGW